MDAKVIELQGREYENNQRLQSRINLSKWSIQRMLKQGLPGSIKVGRVRYFDRIAVDRWLLEQGQTSQQ